MTDLPNLHLTKEQKGDLRTLLFRLNWMDILDEAIKMRPSSWAEKPVGGWRNASDCLNAAVILALEGAGVFSGWDNRAKKKTKKERK